jgi:hypothetical protein
MPGNWANWTERLKDILAHELRGGTPVETDAVSDLTLARLKRAAEDAAECGLPEMRAGLRKARTFAEVVRAMIETGAAVRRRSLISGGDVPVPLTVPTPVVPATDPTLHDLLAAVRQMPTLHAWHAVANYLGDRDDPRAVPLARLLAVPAYKESIADRRLYALAKGFGYPFEDWLRSLCPYVGSSHHGTAAPPSTHSYAHSWAAKFTNVTFRRGCRFVGFSDLRQDHAWCTGNYELSAHHHYARIASDLSKMLDQPASWHVFAVAPGLRQDAYARHAVKALDERYADPNAPRPAYLGFVHRDQWARSGHCDWIGMIETTLRAHRPDARVDEATHKDIAWQTRNT